MERSTFMVDRRGLANLAELHGAVDLHGRPVVRIMERSTFMVDRRGLANLAELHSTYYMGVLQRSHGDALGQK